MRGTTNITDFPGADQVIERTQSFILRMIQRWTMKLIQIYVVGLQTLKRIFAGFDNMVTACAALVGLISHAAVYLGCQHNLLTQILFLQKFSCNPFALTLVIYICSIKKINPTFNRLLPYGKRICFIR